MNMVTGDVGKEVLNNFLPLKMENFIREGVPLVF